MSVIKFDTAPDFGKIFWSIASNKHNTIYVVCKDYRKLSSMFRLGMSVKDFTPTVLKKHKINGIRKFDFKKETGKYHKYIFTFKNNNLNKLRYVIFMEYTHFMSSYLNLARSVIYMHSSHTKTTSNRHIGGWRIEG